MLILASISPRRKELLESVGFKFNLKKPNFDEDTIDASKMKVDEYVLHLAESKSKSVFSNYPNDIVIAADTIVVLGHDIIGKPKDEADAMNILRRLSGKTHQVYTGYAVIRKGDCKTEVSFEKTHVTFREISDSEIRFYVKTGEPMDKAGSYGVQGIGGALVTGINGDYNNVVGLPVCSLVQTLRRFGVEVFR